MELKFALIVTTFWLGFVLAISFFETPIRFSAPLIDMKIGVSIGRLLFRSLHRLEWVFFLLISVLCLWKSASTTLVVCTSGLALLLLAQSVLLVALDKRAQLLLGGETLTPSLP